MRCHEATFPLLTAFFLSSFSLLHLLFSKFSSEILHRVLSYKKNKIWGGQKFGGPPLPPGGQFFCVKKMLRIASNGRKIVSNVPFFWPPLEDMCAEKFPLFSMGG